MLIVLKVLVCSPKFIEERAISFLIFFFLVLALEFRTILYFSPVNEYNKVCNLGLEKDF